MNFWLETETLKVLGGLVLLAAFFGRPSGPSRPSSAPPV